MSDYMQLNDDLNARQLMCLHSFKHRKFVLFGKNLIILTGDGKNDV